jgi:hypothetical protein
MTKQMNGSASKNKVATSAESWAGKITTSWHRTTEAILETGRLLLEAKDVLPHGSFKTMMQLHLPFSVRTAERLMAIARNPVLTKSDNLSLLPPSSGTLYLLSQVDVDRLEAKLAEGTITSRLEAADVKRKVLEHESAEPTTAEPDPDAARIQAETREPQSKPQPDPLPVPEAEAERRAAPVGTVPAAPTDTSDDETELDLEPTSEETLTNAIESVGLLLDTLFDEEIIYELAKVGLDKRDAFFLRLRAEFNKRMDALERMPVLDKADAIAALPESVKANPMAASSQA